MAEATATRADAVSVRAVSVASGGAASVVAALRRHQVAVYAVIILAYVVYCLHQPIGLYPAGPHDDGYYLSAAESVLNGEWLGHYGHMTLIKGPGFVFFLVANHWLGTPLTLTMALFYALGCAALVASLGRSARLGAVWQFVVFNVLLWHPAMVPYRAYRDEIYPALVLLVLAAAIALTFSDMTRRVFWTAVPFGLAFGVLWITREEGIWMVPGLALLGIVSLVRARRQRRTGRVALAWLLAVVVAALPSLAVATVNQHVYGTFTVVDFTGRPFQGAVKAFDSIEAGPEHHYVSVSYADLNAAYEVSPAARELAPYFNDPSHPWQWTDCADKTYRCGEIIAGWFPWALRDAVSSAGHYSSPADANHFYEQLTQEIGDACDSGQLTCQSNPIPLLPAIRGSDLRRVPGSTAHVIARSVKLDTLDTVHPGASAGYPENLRTAISLTGRPFIVPTAEADPNFTGANIAAVQVRLHLESIYRPLTWVVAVAGVLALLAGLVLLALRRPVARRLMVVSGAVWLLYLARVGVLALVDATSFPIDHAMYVGPAYILLLLASLLSAASVVPTLRPARGRRGARARPSPHVSGSVSGGPAGSADPAEERPLTGAHRQF